MAKKPSISFYTSDFITQTMFLSFEDKGKLIMLYCLQHQHGHLSKEQMESVCGNLSTSILNFFQVDDEGKYFNEQIEQSMIERDNFIKRQKEKISKRWKKDTTEYTAEHTTVNTVVIPLEDEDEDEKEIDKEENKGKKVVREKGNLPVKVKKKTPQAIMGDYFKSIYKKHTGVDYLAKGKDYTLLAELIHQYGENVVRQKIEWLEAGCVYRVFWFAKESGINSFTIGNLVRNWNEILPQYTKEQLQEKEKKRQEEETMRRVLANAQKLRQERESWKNG